MLHPRPYIYIERQGKFSPWLGNKLEWQACTDTLHEGHLLKGSSWNGARGLF